MEVRKARLIGNSIHISIPPTWLKYFGIGENNYVQLEMKEDGILIKPLEVKNKVKQDV